MVLVLNVVSVQTHWGMNAKVGVFNHEIEAPVGLASDLALCKQGLWVFFLSLLRTVLAPLFR